MKKYNVDTNLEGDYDDYYASYDLVADEFVHWMRDLSIRMKGK